MMMATATSMTSRGGTSTKMTTTPTTTPVSGHGNGEARDSVAEGNNGMGDIGVCPDCTALMIRVGDSFVADSNDFAQGVFFSVDTGASVIQSALGCINNTRFAVEAVEYAYANNVAFVASAADELSYHHNFPGSGNHSIYVHAVQFDNASPDQSSTFMNYNNCHQPRHAAAAVHPRHRMFVRSGRDHKRYGRFDVCGRVESGA